MTLVIDASVAAGWFLPDEQPTANDAVMQALLTTRSASPSLFWFEVRNVLLMAEKRGRLPSGEALASMVRLRQFPIEDAGAGDDAAILSLCSRRGLSAYDASYLALALEQRGSFATADRRLAAAAAAEGVALFRAP